MVEDADGDADAADGAGADATADRADADADAADEAGTDADATDDEPADATANDGTADETTADEGTVRCWLVDRRSRHENLVTLVYATEDGKRHLTEQLSFRLLQRREVTAARDVPAGKLERTPAEERERYATQAGSMAERHDPDDPV